MGAGALVSWAISRGLLGPWVRVVLGAMLALLIAAGGWWLRTRGSRRFGNVLLALAIAVLHVDAWGAGPRLGLVPAWLSLSVVDLSSLLLAALALVENEEILFSVGMFGALIAPFVMATGAPRLDVLAAYGLAVLAAAVRTIGAKPWWRPVGLVVAGTVLYALRVSGYHSAVPWISREFGELFAAAVGIVALAWERRPSRPWIAVVGLLTMALALTLRPAAPAVGSPVAVLMARTDVHLLALACTALLFIAARAFDPKEQASVWTLAVVLVPVMCLGASLDAIGLVHSPLSGSLVLAWALAYAVASLAERGTRRGALMAASAVASLWAITLIFDGVPAAVPQVASAHALLFAWISKREKQSLVLFSAGVSVFVA